MTLPAVPDDAYAVMTPLGVLGAHFPEEGPVLWTGPQAAKEWVARCLLEWTGPGGAGCTMETMGEDTLMAMNARPECMVVVMEPLTQILAPFLPLQEPSPEPAVPAIDGPRAPGEVPRWPVLEPAKLEDV